MRSTRRLLVAAAAAVAVLAPPAATAEDTFGFAVLPDVQQETSGTRFRDRLQWIVNNRAALNLKFMMQCGDMMNFHLDAHYAHMSEGLKVLDGAAFPYATCLGNHDTAAVREDSGSAAPGNVNTNLRNTTKYNAYFPTTRFRNLAGTYETGKIDNAYHTFTAGGLNWLVLNLELWARTGPVNWAKTVVANHPNHNVIILTHAHLNGDSTIQQNNGGYGDNSPQYIFDNLIKQYANVRLVFSGHVGSHGYRTNTGVKGNTIYQFLQCYHDNTTNPTRLVEINTAAGTLKTRVYCPSINQDKNDGSARTITGIPWVPAASTPSPPSNLKASAVSPSQINLTWTDNASNESNYKVEGKTGAGGTWSQIALLGANATAFNSGSLSASTTYFYRVRASNAGGNSAYSNEASATTQAPPPPPPPNGSGTGLRGEYFDNANFTSPRLVRTDATVNFDWGSGSPDAQLAVNSFAIRWSGAVQPRYSQTYTFYATTDDGVRLWVDGKLLIDHWADRAPAESSGTIALTAGKPYALRMDYYENGGGAVARLAWSSGSQAKQIVPQSQLYPWHGRDVGSVGVTGSDSMSGASFTVKGSGADIWNNADGFHYVYQLLTGDGEIRARVASVQNTNAWAKAGVMMRENFDAGARHAMMVVTPGSGLAFQRRESPGGTSSHTGAGSNTAPYWVRLVRQGNNFSAYRSPDGNAWTWVGTRTLSMPSPLPMGLAVTSHHNGAACTAQFDTVSSATSIAPAGALVTITYVSTAKPYSLATARIGGLPYIDRSYAVTSLSGGLQDGVLVRMAMDDKAATTSSHLTLRLGQAATVYACYDKRGTLPGWLSGWTPTAETLVSTDGAASPMRVYRKSAGAGDLILGGNLQSPAQGSYANYLLVVKPASGKAAPAGDGTALLASAVFAEGPIPPDCWQHEGDTDGDGLRDEFEPGYALDIDKPDTDDDGMPDEGALDADGRTLWEVQEGLDLASSPVDGASGGDGGGGSRCGSIGLDLLLPLGILWLARRPRRKRRI